ncbi:hypothetical protein CANARDRAFT_211632 [[Candida] arabinofermentans NRRL YB-2248]|uniref:TATA-binding protein interacting (TIP20) domain-containing protein n=1 Tax=[Candida] arabinofermentans NRRL YB-2248 TaxID=983967 RepID=A0A1E4T381_9ASCO|nr:hypothetical protein CANARDRAFT_211632 [[Candida] arabinofermentans NRRL YB-2248]
MADAELSLIEKVELRIALANTDDKFESSLKLYLAPLLLKFASPHSPVRTQIGKTVKYLLTRLNSTPNVKLPIDALLKQVKNPTVPNGADPTVVRSYTLLFISKGITRLSEEEKKQLLPQIIEGISKQASTISARLFNILLKLLDFKIEIKNKDDEKSFRAFLKFDENSDDEKFLIEKFYKLMLMQPVQLNAENTIPRGFSFPGLSKDDCAFFTYDAGVTFDSSTLNSYKTSILKFIEYGFDPSSSIILIIGTSDSASSVSDVSLTLLKRRQIDYEDEYLVDTLLSLFVGDLSVARPPAKLQLQEKIMNYCSQSKRAALSTQVGKLSSIGLHSDYPKLKQSTIRFIKWVTTMMATESIDREEELNFSIAAQLRSNLESERQSEVTSNYSLYSLQRRYQYEALGLLLRRAPKLDDLSYVEFLFKMLEVESADLRTSVQESLSCLTVHLEELSDKHKGELKSFLIELINSTTPRLKSESKGNLDACRYMAIKFTNCCFPFSDPEARLLNIAVQTPNDKPDTIEEAKRGLHPYWFNLIQSSNTKAYKSSNELLGFQGADRVQFPTFQSMVSCVKSVEDININSAITFTLQCLVMQAIKGKKTVIVVDQEWETRLEKAMEFDDKVNKLLVQELAKLSSPNQTLDLDGDEEMPAVDFETNSGVLDIFLDLLFSHFIATMNLDTGKDLTNLLAMCQPSTIAGSLSRIESLKQLLQRIVSEDGNLYISKMLGMLCCHEKYMNAEVIATMEELMVKQEVGSLGYIVSRLVLSKREDAIPPQFFDSLLVKIQEGLESTSSRNLRMSLISLSQLSMFGCLGPVLKLCDSVGDYNSKFLTQLIPLVKRSDERATMALSFLAISADEITAVDEPALESNESALSIYEQTLYDTHNSKQTDYLFTSGEAFAVLAAGWDAKIMDKKIDIQKSDFHPRVVRRTDHLPIILKMILKSCKQTKPALRRAGCIWLLSLVQYCGHLPDVKEKLSDIHLSFMRFLSDKDELIQESASRGLSIVYEMGDVELKDTLVHNLLLSFTDSNKTKTLISGSMDKETELFDTGVLNTGDGSVSTYKDILSLASEVGDPSLVYKFMSLAKNSALWSSRKGIAFGLGAILDKSKLDDLITNNEKLSHRLIPKLFRYRFDPSTSVSRTMNEIWSTLIVDSSKTIVANFDIILKDLLTNMGNREWRVRQASAAALQDLLRHASLEDYESKLEEIWTMSFRSMDDIKDSVRKEGNSLTRYMATTMVTRISNANSENASKSNGILQQLIPFLLGSNGLLSESEDVKTFAFDTILKISRTSSLALKPFVCEMIEQMIVLMSSIEPQVINYLTLNADKYNMKSEDIDSQRLNIVGNSPIMEAIEKLMNLLDDNLISNFVICLSNAVKKSVGLPSKVTGSKIIINLIVKNLFIIQNHGDDLLKIAVSQLKDRNETIARSYAVAIGYCVRIASLKKIQSLSKKLTTYYFDSQDNEALKKISAVTSEAISRYSNDKFQSIAAAFLPMAFIGKHDGNKEIAKLFDKEWSDSTSGGANAIKLYLKEIIDLVKANIQSTNFQIRQVIALSIIEVVDRLGDQFGHLSQYLSDLFTILLESLKGRSYAGKENLLNSLVLLSISTPEFFQEDKHADIFEKVKKLVLVEAKRKNKEYAKYSLKSLGKFLGTFPDDELYDEYLALVDHAIAPKVEKTGSDMDVDSSSSDEEEENQNKKLKDAKYEEYKTSVVENLVIALNVKEPSEKLAEYILKTIQLFFDEGAAKSHTYKTQLCAINSLTLLINKLTMLDSAPLQGLIKEKIFETWQVIDKNCTSSESLQNVIIGFIRLTKLMTVKLFDNDVDRKNTCVGRLVELQEQKMNSVIGTEIQKALEDIRLLE